MQRNDVSGFPDGSHIYTMDFWYSYKRMFCFLHAFLKNELNMNAQVGYTSGKVEKNSGLIGSIWEKHIYLNYPRLLIPNPTRVRGTRRSFGPKPARVSGWISGLRIQVDPWRPLPWTTKPVLKGTYYAKITFMFEHSCVWKQPAYNVTNSPTHFL